MSGFPERVPSTEPTNGAGQRHLARSPDPFFPAPSSFNRHAVAGMATVDTTSGLRHYLEILRKHKRIVLAAVLIVPIVAYVYSILQPPAFQATAKVLLSRQNIAAELTGLEDPSGAQLSDRPVITQATIARVPEVVRRTLAAGKRADLSVEEFLFASSVTPAGGSDILEFNVTRTEPWAAEELATAYAQEYTRYRRELDTAPARRARVQLQRRINELRRTGETDTRLYASLVDKEQQLATFQTLQTNNAFVVQESLNAVQVQPTTRRNMMLGLGLGVLLGAALAAIAHALDTRGRTVRSLEEQLGVPLLARIPAPPSSDGPLVMRDDPSSVNAESYRVLRANLEFVNRTRGARVLMATSAIEGEGKSTTIANLAVAYAREGKHVIVVDLDLRRPTIGKLFDVPTRPGVVDVAYRRVSLQSALQKVPAGPAGLSLEIMPTAPVGADIGEFAASEHLRALLEDLRERADLVLVDAPPLLVSSDAITLAASVEGIILVTGQDSLRWEALDDVIRALSMCAAPTVGWVVTGAETLERYAAYTMPATDGRAAAAARRGSAR